MSVHIAHNHDYGDFHTDVKEKSGHCSSLNPAFGVLTLLLWVVFRSAVVEVGDENHVSGDDD